MNKGFQWIVTSIVLSSLLVGCSLSCPTAKDAPTPVAQETPADEKPTATAEPTAVPTPVLRPAIIADVVNAVQADPMAEEAWQAAEEGMEVYQDGRVKAESESTALVDVDEGLVRVAPDTTFVYRRPDDDALELELDAGGQMWLNVDGLEEGGTVDVKSPSAVASVRGTIFSVRDDGGDIIVSTKVGTVTVSSVAGGEVDVGIGHQTTVKAGEAPTEPRGMTLEEEVRWGTAAGPNLDVVLPVVGVVDIFTVTGYTSRPAVSPRGDYLASVYYIPGTPEEGTVVYGVGTGEVYTQGLPVSIDNFVYNPVTGQLAYAQYVPNQICVAEADGSDPTCFEWAGYYAYGDVAWSPDGEWLVFSARQSGVDADNLYKARPGDDEPVQLTYDEGGYNTDPAWSPDGEQIAYVFYEDYEQPGEVRMMGADGSDVRTVLTSTQTYNPPVWNPDGSAVAMAGYVIHETKEGGGLWIVPRDGSDPWLVPETEDWLCNNPAWSPTKTGWPLFFHAYSLRGPDRIGVQWYVPDIGMGPVHLLYASFGPVWSADGARVAFGYSSKRDGDTITAINVFDTMFNLFTPLTE
jgi:hypothetical protein